MSIFIAEIVGTFLLILLGNGVVANVLLKDTKGNGSGWIVITTAWAFAVFIAVAVAAPHSGAHLNPAVTIGLAVAGKVGWCCVTWYILGQIMGAMLGQLAVYVFYKQHFDRTPEHDLKFFSFSTEPAIRDFKHNVFSEFLGTFVLVFVVLSFTDPSMQLADGEPAMTFGLGSLGALNVAILVWVIGLSLGGTTGYAINPARDFGPRVVHSLLFKGKSNWDYAWVPIVGPLLGGAVAALVHYALLH